VLHLIRLYRQAVLRRLLNCRHVLIPASAMFKVRGIGVARKRKYVNVTAYLLYMFLMANSDLCSSSTISSPRVFELDIFCKSL
jgi:hypothetical protein